MPLKKGIVAMSSDFADYIATADDARAVISVAFDDGDPAVIMRMIGAVARSKGMTSLADATDLGRESLYKSLSASGNPELRTLIKVLRAFGLRLAVEPIPGAATETRPRPDAAKATRRPVSSAPPPIAR